MLYIILASCVILMWLATNYFATHEERITKRHEKQKKTEKLSEDIEAQRLLDEYLNESMSGIEIGRLYERYIGYLYEIQGHEVNYHGAVNGYSDLGRDLIVRVDNEIQIVQTKRWSQRKEIRENHIFQLYGSMMHYKLTSKIDNAKVKAVLYASTKYSQTAKEVAKVLGVELIIKKLDKAYPMIKCNISQNGEKIYHLPFDPYYDKIKINTGQGNLYVNTVKEAAARGFRRAQNYKYAA